MPNPLPLSGTGVTISGFPGSVGALGWAAYDLARGVVNAEQGLVSAETTSMVAPGGGTRDLSVTAGEWLLPGLRVVTTAAQIVGPADPGTAGSNRMDLLVLEADWLANTNAGEARLRIVKGSAGRTPPIATQNLGTGVWQMPIARAVLRGAGTSYAAADIDRVVPLPRWERRYVPAVTVRNVRGSTNWVTLATADIIDPGWAYRLDCRGQMRFDVNAGESYGVIRAYDQTSGDTIATGISGTLNRRDTAQFSEVQGLKTGARQVTFDLTQNGAPTETALLETLTSLANYFTVIQRPA